MSLKCCGKCCARRRSVLQSLRGTLEVALYAKTSTEFAKKRLFTWYIVGAAVGALVIVLEAGPHSMPSKGWALGTGALTVVVVSAVLV